MEQHQLGYAPKRPKAWRYYVGWIVVAYFAIGTLLILLDLADPMLRPRGNPTSGPFKGGAQNSIPGR